MKVAKQPKKAFVGGIVLGLLTSTSLPLTCLKAAAQSPSPNPAPSATSQAATQTQAPSSTFNRPSKDFKYRKRFIAPSSDLNSRIDYASMQSRDSLMLPTYEPTYGKGQQNGQSTARPPVTYQPIHPDEPGEALKAQAQSLNSTSLTRKPTVSRDGLTPPPPPPPANNRLLPSSLTRQTPPSISQTPSSTSQAAPETNTTPLSAAHIAQIKAHVDTLAKQGHLAEAQEVLSRVLVERPHEPVLRAELSKISLDRARFYAKQGSAPQAASQARMAIAYGSAYSSASESAYSLLASSLSKSGIDPKNPEARASLGAILMQQNSPMEAEIEYRQAIKLKPTSDFYIGAGSAALQSGNRTSAKMDFQKALELNPDAQPALSKLGIVRYQMRDYVGANADLTRALVMDSQDTVAAQTLIDLWQRQVASRPQDASSHLGLARAYQVTGDLDSARKEYKTVVQIDPNHPNLPAARQSFKLALAKREARKSFDLAHSFESQGQLPMAYQKASDSVELYPSDTNYQTYKAQLAGQLQSAGMPVYAASGQAMSALSYLMQNGEQPAAASLPTAQALGLNGAMAPQAPPAPPAPFAADNMYKPLSTDSHITSMTGFLASLRNFTMQQQAQQSGASAGGGLGMSGIGAGGASGAGGLAGIPGFAPSNPLPGSGLSPSLDQGQMIAQGAGVQQALAQGAASTASGGPVTASSALAAAAAALANTAGGNSGGMAGGMGNSMSMNMGNGMGSNMAGGMGSSMAGGMGGGMGSSMAGGMGGGLNGGMSGGFLSGLGAALGQGSGTTLGATAGAPMAATQMMAPTAANLGVSNSAAAMALGLTPQPPPTMAQTMLGGLGNVASYLAKNGQQQQQTPVNTAIQPGGQMNYSFTPSGNFGAAQTMPTMVTQRVITSPGGNIATAQSLSINPEPTNVAWPQPQPLPDASSPATAAAVGAAPTSTFVATANPAAASDPTSAATAATLAPPIAPPGQASMGAIGDAAAYMSSGPQGMPAQLRSLIPPGALKLYLTGVKASKTDVELQVSLRNDSPIPLKIPSGIKAVVRSTGQPDKQAKVSFTNKVVNSGSTVTGTIKVPGKNLDPTADVVIPTSDLTKGAIADIHLSVPISAR